MSLQKRWQDTLSFALNHRRALHQQPELSWQEESTAKMIRDSLTELGIPWQACARLGTLARFKSGVRFNTDEKGEHIALRADMDALPIDEQSGVGWCSHNSGVMHACGHDGHTAALLGTARWLKQHEDQLAQPVTLLFQPAEEGEHGAREMIADGALTGIDRIYGWHNWPGIPFGKLLCPEGTVMAGNGTFSIELTGQGGHASQPDQCRDPVLAAAAITMNLQQIIARRLPPQTSAVVSVTSIDAVSGLTVIPETARLAGSIRLSSMDDKKTIEDLIVQISQDTARSYGVACHVTLQPRYQPTVNHGEPAQMARETWAQLYGESSLDHTSAVPIMASEDFSYYLNEIPGAFALIGADDGPDHQYPCHSAYYDFNDRLLAKAMGWYCGLVGIPCPEQREPDKTNPENSL